MSISLQPCTHGIAGYDVSCERILTQDTALCAAFEIDEVEYQLYPETIQVSERVHMVKSVTGGWYIYPDYDTPGGGIVDHVLYFLMDGDIVGCFGGFAYGIGAQYDGITPECPLALERAGDVTWSGGEQVLAFRGYALHLVYPPLSTLVDPFTPPPPISPSAPMNSLGDWFRIPARTYGPVTVDNGDDVRLFARYPAGYQLAQFAFCAHAITYPVILSNAPPSTGRRARIPILSLPIVLPLTMLLTNGGAPLRRRMSSHGR